MDPNNDVHEMINMDLSITVQVVLDMNPNNNGTGSIGYGL